MRDGHTAIANVTDANKLKRSIEVSLLVTSLPQRWRLESIETDGERILLGEHALGVLAKDPEAAGLRAVEAGVALGRGVRVVAPGIPAIKGFEAVARVEADEAHAMGPTPLSHPFDAVVFLD